MEEFGYEKLDARKVGMELTDLVYRHARSFPKEEQFGLASQMRRSASSIPSNIAEGSSYGPIGNARHLRIARGSSYELRTQIEVAQRQGFVKAEDANHLATLAKRSSQLIEGLLRSLPTED